MQTIHLINKQHTAWYPFKIFPSSLMHFHFLIRHAFMYCWKDYSGMLFCPIVMALLMTSTPSKRVTDDDPLLASVKEQRQPDQNQVNRDVVPVWRWLECCEQVHRIRHDLFCYHPRFFSHSDWCIRLRIFL